MQDARMDARGAKARIKLYEIQGYSTKQVRMLLCEQAPHAGSRAPPCLTQCLRQDVAAGKGHSKRQCKVIHIGYTASSMRVRAVLHQWLPGDAPVWVVRWLPMQTQYKDVCGKLDVHDI